MGLIVCILSGFFWAAFDLTRKISIKTTQPYSLLIYLSLLQLFFFSVWIIVEPVHFEPKFYFIPGIILIFINILSGLLFLKSLKISDLSLTIPLLSFTPLFSAVFSSFLLNENLNFAQYIGIFFIIFGTMILYSKSLYFKEIFYSLSNLLKNSGARYMLIVSMIWSLTPILDKMCFEYSSINMHGFIQSLGMFFLLVLISYKKRSIKLKGNIGIIILTVLIGLIATIIQFFAITMVIVPIMETIKRTMGQFFSVIFGKIFFDEKINKQKILGVIFLSIGISKILF